MLSKILKNTVLNNIYRRLLMLAKEILKKVNEAINQTTNEVMDKSLPWVVLQWTADGDKRVVGTYNTEDEAKKVADEATKKYPRWDAGEFTVTSNTPELAKTIG
jgi:hypothetical protein